MTAVGTVSVLPGRRTTATRAPAPSPAARLPFCALMVFTFVALVAPQNLFPVLTPLHLALVAVAVAAAAHVADQMARAKPLIVMEQEIRLALLFMGLAVLSIPTSFWPAGSVDTLLQLLVKSLVVFLLVANIVVTPERLRATFWLLTACSVAPALVVVKDYLAGNLVRARVQGYVGALTSNPNDVALTLNIVIPLAVGLAFTTRSRRQQLALAAIVALAAGGVVVTFSRAGFLFLSTTVLLYLARVKRGRTGIVLLLLLLVVLMLNVDGFIDRIQSIVDVQTESSAHARWLTMKSGLHLILAYPVFGVGLGQNMLALNEIGAPRWSLIHNVYLQVAVDLGLPALVVYLLLFCGVLRAVVQARRAWRARGVDLSHLAQGLEISLIGFAVAAMFYPIAYHLFFYYLAGLAVAVKRLGRQALPGHECVVVGESAALRASKPRPILQPENERRKGAMKSSGRRASVICFSVIFGLLGTAVAHAETFGGRAFAAFVNVPTLGAGPLFLADTGELAALGGAQSADLQGARVPQVLSAEVLNSAIVGNGGAGSGSSSLAAVTLLPGSVAQLTASFVRSEALATASGSQGSTEVRGLKLAGLSVPVTGEPNQTVAIPGAPILGLLGQVIGRGPSPGTLIINEQMVTSDGVSQEITVNALRLILATGEEAILGSARGLVNPDGQLNLADGRSRVNRAGKVRLASLTDPVRRAKIVTVASSGRRLVRPAVNRGDSCSAKTMAKNLLWKLGARSPFILAEFPPSEEEHPCLDFMTGGGFFFGSSDGGPGARVNFGFNAGYKNGTRVPLQVHFNLVDHSSGRHIKVQSPISYEFVSCECRRFSGPDSYTGFTVTVEACDFAEPGRDIDTITVIMDDGYSANIIDEDSTIAGGNIQLHKACLEC